VAAHSFARPWRGHADRRRRNSACRARDAAVSGVPALRYAPGHGAFSATSRKQARYMKAAVDSILGRSSSLPASLVSVNLHGAR
jgi:hypothetical protein